MLTGEYCNRDVVMVARNDSIVKAAKLMREYHVGNVIVIDINNNNHIPVGILTDRDIIVGILAKEIPIDDVVVDDVASHRLITASESDDLMMTIKRMRTHGIRRTPVVNDSGNLIGILSIDNILDVITEQLMDIDQLISIEQRREKALRV